MTDGSRTTRRRDDGAPRVPAGWKRYKASGLPSKVTIVAIPLIGTTWYSRGARYWQLRIGLAILLLAVSAGYLALYALVLWDDHKRNGYSPAFWITAGIITAITVAGVIDSVLSQRKPLTRVRRIGNPILRSTAGIVRVLTILVLRFLTPGLYLAVLFGVVRAHPGNEQAARADLMAQLGGREHSSAGHRHPRRAPSQRAPRGRVAEKRWSRESE